MTTPKRPRTILAVEAELAAAADSFGYGSGDNHADSKRAHFMLGRATVLLADANREIEKLEAENTLLKLQRARRRVGVGR